MALTVPLALELVVDEEQLRESYYEHVKDCAWWLAHPEEGPGWGDQGYGVNVPPPWEVYRDDVVESIVAEIAERDGWPWHLRAVPLPRAREVPVRSRG